MSSCVFNSYLKLVNDRVMKEKKPFYESGYFDVWLCPGGMSFSGINDINANMYTYSKNNVFDPEAMTHLGILGKIDIECNGDDGMNMENTYEEIFDLPLSAYLFSEHDCPQGITFTTDTCYTAYDYEVYDRRLHQSAEGIRYISEYDDSGKATTNSPPYWDSRSRYFQTEYNFSNNYDQNEYKIYDGPQDYLVGNNVMPMTNNVSLNSDVHNSQGGALLITWYSGARIANISADYVNRIKLCRTKEETAAWSACSGTYMLTSARPVDAFTEGKAAVPCIYYELPLNYKLKNAIVNIQWSENGLYIFK